MILYVGSRVQNLMTDTNNVKTSSWPRHLPDKKCTFTKESMIKLTAYDLLNTIECYQYYKLINTSYSLMTVTSPTQSLDAIQWLTLLILQELYAVSVSVAIEMPWDDLPVVVNYLHKSLIVEFSDDLGVPGIGQVTHWNMSNDNLQRDDRRNSMLRHDRTGLESNLALKKHVSVFHVISCISSLLVLRIHAGQKPSAPSYSSPNPLATGYLQVSAR